MVELAVFVVGVALGAAVSAAILLARKASIDAALARTTAELAAVRGALDEERARVGVVESQLGASFAVLSKAALSENRTDFLERAEDVLKPVRDTLERVHRQLTEVDKAREGSFQAVATELRTLSASQETLRSAAEGLTRSLRSPNVRGKWGEVQLRRIVELAGMLGQCDFVEKPTSLTEDGVRRTPDLIVRLPGGSNIVVDAKVPIDAYLASTNAQTDAERQDRLAAHTRQLREHVNALGAKEYWRQFEPAPEFVVMFLPLEPLLAAAFEHDGGLLEQAASVRVIPATPMTLLALLKAVAYGWQQQTVRENTEQIQALGRELYDRLATLVQHVEHLGDGLKQAANSYDKFIGSLERSVLPGARRFRELGVSATKDLPAPDPINLSLRTLKADELAPVESQERLPTGPVGVVR